MINFATLYYTWLGWRDRGSGSACHKSNELTRRNIPASRVNLQEITEPLNVRTAIQKAKGVDLRTRNRPTCNTVTVIWLGELNDTLFCTSDVVDYRELAICNRRNIHCSSLCGCHHGELGWHSAVPNQGDATSHNNKNNRVPCREFVANRLYIRANGYSLLHRAARLFLREISTLNNEMSVPSLPGSPGTSTLVTNINNW